MDTTPELFVLLADFCPRWQTQYDTLREAAVAAQLLPEYYAYMATSEGRLRAIRLSNVPDTLNANRAIQQARSKALTRMLFEYGDEDGDEFKQDE